MTEQTPPDAPQGTDDLPPYSAIADEQRAIWRSKGQRYVVFGIIWLVAGIIITAWTYSLATRSGGVYVVAYGPMLYGVYRIVRGIFLLGRDR